jgi:hypothetical protein
MQPLPRYLVAIDLGRVTGWAHGPFSAVQPEFGSWPFPAKDPLDAVGARIAALDNTLSRHFDLWSPSHVVAAEPIPARNMGEAIASFGMLGQLRAECWRRQIEILVQPEGTVRKEMLGRGTAPTDAMKDLVLAWCKANGLDVPDHNAGDACVLWRWARDELARQRVGRVA